MSSGSNSTAVAETDSFGSFQNLQATFSSTRRARPPPISTENEAEVRVPLKPNKLQRRESKGGLRGIFTRNKVDKNVVSPVQEEFAPPSAISQRSMREVAERSIPRSTSVKSAHARPEPSPVVPTTPATKTPRMTMRSKSVKQNKNTPKSNSKTSPKSTTKPPTRTSAAWDPPPLFQAYPQAIKHAQLSASTLSADSILRISNHKRNNSLRDDLNQARGKSDAQDQSAAVKKAEKAKSKHRRQISGSISKADWTQKIFVLVTSGYLLQYSGEGSFDRLPEKMMQLGKDSVAFASDVIPGKHWVLQISQAMDADGTPAADSRSLLSRLAFRNADYRRTATSLLLVLNSAEDMDSWIAVVRREIEALGGKKHVSETGKPKPDEKVMQLRAQPSHRYLVARNPDQLSNPSSPMSPSFETPPWSPSSEKLDDEASTLARPLSSATRPMTGHQSIANSMAPSHDGRQPENVRDNVNRLSYMSSGQRTLVTSQSSSAASSPTRESASTFDEVPSKMSTEDTRPRPNASAINERRRSMQTIQIPVLEAKPKPFRPHSTFGAPIRPSSSHSPTTPNFSVPASSNRRYSLVKTPTLEAPPIPTIITTTPSKTMLKGTRKPPPAALHVARPLSPVDDSPLNQRSPPVFTPTESSFKKLTQVRASVIDIPARTPGSPTEMTPPRRFSSLKPLNSFEMSHIDFQFPRRHSSMQALREAVDNIPEAPLRPAPLPPAALETPLPVSPFITEPEEAFESAEPKSEYGPKLQEEPEIISPLPILTPAKTKIRRPNSMQIPPSILSPSSHSASCVIKSAKSARFASPTSNRHSPSAASSETLNYGAKSPASTSLKSPSIQRLKAHAHAKTLANRRSMPMLANGPPPAPPPDCALPPLPPGSGGIRSPMGLRNSVRV